MSLPPRLQHELLIWPKLAGGQLGPLAGNARWYRQIRSLKLQ